MKRALILGGGITGLTSAWLLAGYGWQVHCLAQPVQTSPTLILNDVTCELLQNIWQLEASFWQRFHLLQHRQVRWGGVETLISVSSLVIKGNTLAALLQERLLQAFRRQVTFDDSPGQFEQMTNSQFWPQISLEFSWIIDASGRRAAIGRQFGTVQTFGQRLALCQAVELTQCAEHTNWIEAVDQGWVFLAPLGDQQALLQAIVPRLWAEPCQLLPDLLAQTSLIKHQVGSLLDTTSFFSAFPQILEPLSGQAGNATWMAVGDAAFSVDPICGDGTGYALRGAILSTSLLEGMASSQVDDSGLHHYTLRLRQAFSAHLQACLSYYAVGFLSPAWQAEINQMQAFDPFSQTDLPGLRYRLQGLKLFKLIPIQ